VYPGLYYDDPVAVKMLRVAGLGVDEVTLQQRILREVQLQVREKVNCVIKIVCTIMLVLAASSLRIWDAVCKGGCARCLGVEGRQAGVNRH
jgi:hypothetical protein